jgi:hypothetical protein
MSLLNRQDVIITNQQPYGYHQAGYHQAGYHQAGYHQAGYHQDGYQWNVYNLIGQWINEMDEPDKMDEMDGMDGIEEMDEMDKMDEEDEEDEIEFCRPEEYPESEKFWEPRHQHPIKQWLMESTRPPKKRPHWYQVSVN